MKRRPAVVLRPADVVRNEHPYLQRLHPGASPFRASRMARDAGLEHLGVSRGRIPPGGASFAYHAHLLDEEWIYVLEGRGVARVDGESFEVGPGDFIGFPAPQVAHQLTNPFDADLVYLFGGDDHPIDILDYPDLDRRYVLEWDGRRTVFRPLGPAEYPFERLDLPTASRWRVLAQRGWGSVIAEAALAAAGVPYDREEVDMDGGREALRAVNPLGQLPTVVLPDGNVMTESAAIVIRLAELAPDAGLAPPPSSPDRARFLRWLTFLVAAVYPTFTYGDEPTRWVTAGEELRRSTNEHRVALWRQLEAEAGAPWFLGSTYSALDIYVCAMTRWRPGRAWFAEHAPRLHAIAIACDRRPELAAVWKANFD